MAKNDQVVCSVEDHFRGRDPSVRVTYDRILEAARRFGAVGEEPKKTSIHLTNRTAFAGVATRRSSIVLTLKLPVDLKSPRVSRHERASANRWHLEIRLLDSREVDREVRGWLREAYGLAR